MRVSIVSLDNGKRATVSLVDAPASTPEARQNPRMLTITDMNYVNGNLLVADLVERRVGPPLLCSIPVSLTSAAKGTTLQIWHRFPRPV